MKTIKLHLLRHGMTQGNLDGIYMGGGLDVPLCEEGKEQLRELAARFTYPAGGVLFSSPMRRALETAAILYPEMGEITVLEDLRENRFGAFEGRKLTELLQNPDFAKWLDPKSDFVPEGGESGRVFAARVDRALQAMLEHQAENGIGEAVCVTHGGVIMAMLTNRALPQRPALEWQTDNGCGFTIQTDAGMLMRGGPVEAVEVLPRGYLER